MTKKGHTPETFAEYLDTIVPPGRLDTPEGNSDPLIDAAILIAAPAQPEALSAEAKMRIRTQVLAASQLPVRPRWAQPAIRWVMRWGIAASLVLVLLFIGLQPTVLASVPGDALYPLKQAVETVELLLASTEENRAFTHLAHAERRTQEALTLVGRGQLEPGLLTAALEEMHVAARIVRADTNMGAHTIVRLEARTVQVNTLLNAVLTLADQSDQIPQEPVADLAQQVQATQASGALLLPSTPTATPLPSSTPPATTLIPSPTLIPTTDPSAIPGLTQTPTNASPTAAELPVGATAASDGPTTIVVEGPIEAININIITVFGIDIRLDPATPILSEIQVGDVVRVEGTMVTEGEVIIIIAITVTRIETEVIVPSGGQPPNPNSGGLPTNCKVTPKGKIKCSKTSKKS